MARSGRSPGLALAAIAALVLVLIAWFATSGGRDEPSPSVSSSVEGTTAVDLSAATAERAEKTERSAAAAAEPSIACRVRLRRWPDGELLARVDVSVGGADGARTSATTDEAGVLALAVVEREAKLRLEMARFEPVDFAVPSDPPAEPVTIDCTPTFGLWGRTIRQNGTPIAGADVELFELTYSVRPDPSRELVDRAALLTRTSSLGKARTSAEGWYYVAVDSTRSAHVRVVATKDALAAAEIELALPSASHQLPDAILLDDDTTLRVRVLRESGEPIAGAQVSSFSGGTSRLATTDSDGLAVIARAPHEAYLSVFKEGVELNAKRKGFDFPREEISILPELREVEIVVVDGATLVIRAIDRADGRAIPRAWVRITPAKPMPLVQPLDLRTQDDGTARAHIGRRFGDRVVVSVNATARDGVSETIDVPRVGPKSVELVYPLDVATGVTWIRGIVVCAGCPIADRSVTAHYLTDHPERRWYSPLGSVHTDGEGRFALPVAPSMVAERWMLLSSGVSEPRAFGAAGPMSLAEACASEVQIELAPLSSVPIAIVGLADASDYRVDVSVSDGEFAIRVGSEKLDADARRSGRVLVRVPSNRRASVRVELYSESSRQPWSDSVEIDPTQPLVERTLHARPLFTVAGRASSAADPGAALFVSVGNSPSDFHKTVRVDTDGSFRVAGLAPGRYDVRLLRGAAPFLDVLARRELEVERDVEGVTLVPDAPARAK